MYREIVTKAVVGKGVISNEGEIIVSTDYSVSKVLGCWIINHMYDSVLDNGKVFAKGKYDVHIWCGCDCDTQTIIHKQTVDYNEEFKMSMKQNDSVCGSNELFIKCLKYPSCSGLTLNSDGTINVKIEKELRIDVIGEVKLKVQISNEEEWINNEDLNGINVDYLNKE